MASMDSATGTAMIAEPRASSQPLEPHSVANTDGPRCRFCGARLQFTLVDLGMSPLCESYVTRAQLNRVEHFFPLHVYVCDSCYLVQLEEYVTVEEIFGEYAYFSS